MDTRTGEIAPLEHFRHTLPPDEFAQFVKPVELANLPAAVRRELARGAIGKIGRNHRCPCGSGQKFKRCCLHRGTGRIA